MELLAILSDVTWGGGW